MTKCRWASLLALVALPVAASNVEFVRVDRHGDRFQIDVGLVVAGSAPRVFEVLQRYRALLSSDPDVKSVQVRQHAPHQLRLHVVMRSCILFFCRTFRQSAIVTASASKQGGSLHAQLLPSNDFKSGNGRWIVRPLHRQSAKAAVVARLDLRSNFWIPPLIGQWLIRVKVEDEAERLARGLQRLSLYPAFSKAR